MISPEQGEEIREKEAAYFDNWARLYLSHRKPDALVIDPCQFLKEMTLSVVCGGSEPRAELWARALDVLGLDTIPGKTILDYACGVGRFGVFLALKGAARVEGFDISAESVKIATLRAQINRVEDRANFTVMSADKLEYESETFDIVFGTAALHHTHKYPNVEKELHRVLKNGGRAIFAESLGCNPLFEGLRAFLRWKSKKGEAGETNLRYCDIFRVGAPFSETKIYELTLVFALKRVFQGHYGNAPTRAVLRLAKKVDGYLLTIPSLRRYCGEVVIEYIK